MNRRITRRAFHFAVPLLALAGCSALSPRGVPVSAVRDLSELLETQRQQEALPAVAAAIIHRVEVVAHGVSGVRKLGAAQKVELGDRWHPDYRHVTRGLWGQGGQGGQLAELKFKIKYLLHFEF
ncbi:MAG: hypothetical protein AB4426_19730 [Xenococcaceae cyanobacterium]